jgi:hypothetical protein
VCSHGNMFVHVCNTTSVSHLVGTCRGVDGGHGSIDAENITEGLVRLTTGVVVVAGQDVAVVEFDGLKY